MHGFLARREQAFATLRAGRTSFVIAHRLSTIQRADLTAHMECGNAVKQASHAALVLANGRYWSLLAATFCEHTIRD